MAQRRKQLGLDAAAADAAVMRAVERLAYDAVRAALHDALAGVRLGAEAAMSAEGCGGEPSALSEAVGRSIGAAIRQAFEDAREGVALDAPGDPRIRGAVQENVFQSIRGAVAGAVSLHLSVRSAKWTKT